MAFIIPAFSMGSKLPDPTLSIVSPVSNTTWVQEGTYSISWTYTDSFGVPHSDAVGNILLNGQPQASSVTPIYDLFIPLDAAASTIPLEIDSNGISTSIVVTVIPNISLANPDLTGVFVDDPIFLNWTMTSGDDTADVYKDGSIIMAAQHSGVSITLADDIPRTVYVVAANGGLQSNTINLQVNHRPNTVTIDDPGTVTFGQTIQPTWHVDQGRTDANMVFVYADGSGTGVTGHSIGSGASGTIDLFLVHSYPYYLIDITTIDGNRNNSVSIVPVYEMPVLGSPTDTNTYQPNQTISCVWSGYASALTGDVYVNNVEQLTGQASGFGFAPVDFGLADGDSFTFKINDLNSGDSNTVTCAVRV